MRYKFICAHIFEFIYFSIHPPTHSTVFIQTYCALGNIYAPNISIECLKYFLVIQNAVREHHWLTYTQHNRNLLRPSLECWKFYDAGILMSWELWCIGMK